MKYHFLLPLLVLPLLAPTCKNDPEEAEAEEPTGPEVIKAEDPKDKEIFSVHEGPNDKAPYDETPVEKAWSFPYDLLRPSAKFKLPDRLDEISGLSMSAGGTRLLAVNDEAATIFFIDKDDGKLLQEIEFGKKGDYEGIEMVGDDIFVVENNGDIHTVENTGTEDQRTETFKTDLSSDNDVEGLGYDEKTHSLLLACKRNPGKGFEGQRAIYRFSIMAEKLEPAPAYLIHGDDIKAYFEVEGIDKRLLDLFSPDAAASNFAPSGIAVHPRSGDVYILSAQGKLLMVMSNEGEIRHIEKLDNSLLEQPEGICFDGDGTLFLSTEGKGRRGRIFRYPMEAEEVNEKDKW